MAVVSLPALALEHWAAPETATGMKNPLSASKEVLAKGRELYADRCADCHGRKGRGDGNSGSDLESRPSDLTASSVQTQTDGALFWKISEGRRPMPAYNRKLSEEQRWQVVHYLRSFASKPNPKSANSK